MDRGSTTQIEDYHAAIGRAFNRSDMVVIPLEGRPGWRPVTIEQLRWLNREVINGRLRIEKRTIGDGGSWTSSDDCWNPMRYDYRVALEGS